jgi:hypothetical protein
VGATPSKLVGGIFGAVYVLVGLVGFVVNPIVVFQVNTLHNVVHILVGALLLAGYFGGELRARQINLTVGAVYLVLGILGFFVGPLQSLLALNTADHFLHLATAVVLLGVGLSARSRTSVTG